MSTTLADRLWLAWFIISFLAFIIPETIALVTKHPEFTLSASVWRLEQYDPTKGLRQWNAFHLLFAGELLLLDVWLFAHFIFRKFT
jgi:hypothetical protein